jgi:hypothetical protein
MITPELQKQKNKYKNSANSKLTIATTASIRRGAGKARSFGSFTFRSRTAGISAGIEGQALNTLSGEFKIKFKEGLR